MDTQTTTATTHPSKGPEADPPLSQFWQPRFWPIWLGLGLLRLIVALPQELRMAAGASLGRMGMMMAGKRRRYARRNLELCFPELYPNEIRQLLTDHFRSLGMSLVELGMSWWCSEHELQSLFRLSGWENLEEAMADSEGGVVALSGHFVAMELSGRVMRTRVPRVAAVYRPSRNPLLDTLIRRSRRDAAAKLLPKEGMRDMIRLLRQGWVIWYGADQSYRRKFSVLVPFFGEPAMTNGALSRIAEIGKAAVVPWFPRRLPGGRGYVVDVYPKLQNFPTGDMEKDATRINSLLETQIRKAPEQYYWVHRRFKGRPDPLPDPYR